jgi:PAS domain S-box-containing protein
MIETVKPANAKRPRLPRLRASSARLAAIVEHSDDAIVGKDINGVIVDWNPAAERLYGYTASEAVGQSITLLAPDGREHEFLDVIARLAAGEVIPHHETQRRRKDGSLVHLSLTVTAIRDRSGRVVGSSSIARDIAEQTASAALIAGQMRALERMVAEDPLSDVLDELVRTIESQASRTLLASIMLFDDAHARLIVGGAPNLPEAYLAAIDGAAVGPAVGSCGTAAYRRETVIVEDIAASPLWVDYRDIALANGLRACWSVPIFGADGALLGTFAIYHPRPYAPSETDKRVVELLSSTAAVAIERSRAAQERERLLASERAARAEAEEALRLRDALIAFATHDLRTPLTTIKGQAQLLRRQSDSGRLTPEGLTRGLASIDSASTTLDALINELLDSAIVQAGQPLLLRPQPTDLVALARRCAAEQQQATTRHVIQVETDVDTLVGEWDALRLERVLNNLLNNAIKYSPDGGTITVNVARQQCAGRAWAALAVRDEGLGIPAADLPHLFERFHRAANVAQHISGIGIGLTGSRQIVEQHGGTLTVESQEGVGSTFTMRVPLEPPA